MSDITVDTDDLRAAASKYTDASARAASLTLPRLVTNVQVAMPNSLTFSSGTGEAATSAVRNISEMLSSFAAALNGSAANYDAADAAAVQSLTVGGQ